MGNIEDSLRKAWDAMMGKNKTPSVKDGDKDDKTENHEEKSMKLVTNREKIEEESEKINKNPEVFLAQSSLEEIALETSESISKTSSKPENFFSNKPSEESNSKSREDMEREETDGGAVPSYVITPKKQDEPHYSSRNSVEEIRRVERPFSGEQRNLERGQFQQPAMFDQTSQQKRMPPTESILSRNDEFMKSPEFERPYEHPKLDPLERKYKLLK